MDDGRFGSIPAEMDPALAPLLALSAAETESLLAALVSAVVADVVDPILHGRAGNRPPDVLAELRADVIVRLLGKLRAMLTDRSIAIASFRDYAAVVTYHAFGDWMRQMFPQWTRLKNQVRYLVEHDARFTIERTNREIVVSLIAAAPASGTSPAEELLHAIGEVLTDDGGVMELDALVTGVADRCGIRDHADVPLASRAELSTSDGTEARLENRDYLRRLWREIAALPLRQRMALLLNLRDGDGDAIIRLLPITGIAPLREIARVLELEPRELDAIWDSLPMPDMDIASRLGVARQQVINLRKSARERLARRMMRS